MTSIGFDTSSIRRKASLRSHWPAVVAAGGPDAHVLVTDRAQADRLAAEIVRSSSVVSAAGPGHVAVRLAGSSFAHVLADELVPLVAGAVRCVELGGHGVIPLLSRYFANPGQRVYDTRVAAGLLHYASSEADADFDLSSALVAHGLMGVARCNSIARTLAAETSAVGRLRAALDGPIDRLGLRRALDLDHHAATALAAAARRGLLIDRGQWQATLADERSVHAALDARLKAALGVNDLESSAKVRMGLLGRGVDAPGTRTVELIPFANDQVVADLIEYRRVHAFLSDLGPSIVDHMDADDRVHAVYDPVGAATGRISTRSPNVMGLPRKVRKHVVAPPGWSVIDADYSAIELRIVASLAHEQRLLDAFNNKVDVHRLTAALVTGKAYADVTKEERQRAKPVNFGLLYGMSINGFIKNSIENYGLSFSRHEAALLRERFFRAYSAIAAWHARTHAATSPHVRSTSGRARFIPSPTEKDSHRPFRVRANSPIQGTVADGMKQALGLLVRRLPKYDAHIVATVHDQVLVEVRDELAEEVLNVVRDSMLEGMTTFVKKVPIEVEATIKKSWGG